MKTVGIPQGLFYYYYFPLYKTFFQELGAQVVVSPPTSRNIVDIGVSKSVNENCLPVKVYYGHVHSLADQGVDYLFIPRMVSVETKNYICPKLMGIPDMIKANIHPLPECITPTIDLHTPKHKRQFHQELIKSGRYFTADRHAIQAAYKKGLQELKKCQALAGSGCTMAEAIQIWDQKRTPPSRTGNTHMTIGVLGHGYSLYDPMISMNLIARLRRLQVQVMLPEDLEAEEIGQGAAALPKHIFWSLGHMMVGSALHFDRQPEIDGLIYLACFGCGPDSFIGEMIQRKIRHKPFMLLTIDEHTGENGLMTRLEAFCDMLQYRKQRKKSS